MNYRSMNGVLVLVVFGVGPLEIACGLESDASHPARPPAVAAELMAHWTFDERDGGVIGEATSDPTLQIRADVNRVRGVYGNALELRGSHQLQVRAISTESSWQQIALSAWVRPADLSGYREIYRQECAQRLLFSFQNNGTILSLGLNIGGYVECDATLDRLLVLDGAWHHAAASFDGQALRVYLDGRQIGHLARSGVISTDSQAPAFLGSSGGAGEHFQGGLDDLRIYRQALSADQVSALYRQGLDTLAARFIEYEKKLVDLYQPAATFAQTLADFRQAVSDHKLVLDRDFMGILLTRLRSRFSPGLCRLLASNGLQSA